MSSCPGVRYSVLVVLVSGTQCPLVLEPNVKSSVVLASGALCSVVLIANATLSRQS